MTYIQLPDDIIRPLPFYLAMEEYVARDMDEDDCFFMWQVAPTVIFGRNQLMENEVNMDYCQQHGIAVYRRKSGGGCVYADMGNVMLSYVTSGESVQFTYNRYVSMVTMVLCEMGIDARATGRNDILIGGAKVSGNAFYHLAGRNVVHGTLLYDTSMENMTGAITPSREKLQSKGVDSVLQHITLLKDHTTLTLPEVKEHIRRRLCRDTLTLTTDAVARIEEMAQEYLGDDFINGNNPRCTISRRKRIEGVGEMEVLIEMNHGRIRHVTMRGDYLQTGDLAALLSRLEGVTLDGEALSNVLPADMNVVIAGMTRDNFIELLINP